MRPGVLPHQWLTGGPNCIEVPDWQVHEYNADFFIIRESGCTHYEKPFLYLLFGKDRAILQDTGSGKNDSARIVTQVVAKWLARNRRQSIPLIVMHSHAHDDHIAGDDQFKGLPNITVVPATIPETKELYGIPHWPDDIGHIDLGARVLDVIPIPGHNEVSVALYDRQTGVLLTGDSLYPGRLYVNNFADFVRSTDRLADFTRGKIVTHLFGCHIEQSSTPYLDYPLGSMYQPHEHSLELSRSHILELAAALHSMNGIPRRMAMPDYSIWPVTP